MFRALLAHPQEALHKRHLVYCVRVISVGYAILVQPTEKHARNIPSALFAAPPEAEKVMLETCRGSYCLINCIRSASRWFHYTDIKY
jgi:hypothetical protein